MDRPLLLGRGAADEWSDGLSRVEVVVADRVPARRMRADEGGMDEEGRIGVLLQPLHHGPAYETRLGEFGRKARRSPGRTVSVRPRESLYRLVQIVGVGRDIEPLPSEPPPPRRAPLLPRVFDHGAESGQHALVAEQPRVAGRHGTRIDRGVGVPEQHRVVAHRTSQERHVREPGVQRRAIEYRPIAVLVRARVEAGSRRSARRRVGPVVCEQDAPAGQRVQGGSLEDRMAERRKAVPAPLVESDEENVAGRRHATTLAEVACPRARTLGWTTWHPHRGRTQEVRIVVPPSLVPNSISHAPRRGATARRTARPPVTGRPGAERCTTPISVVDPSGAARRTPADAIRSLRWASARDCTACVWIIRSPRPSRSFLHHNTRSTHSHDT